MGYLDVRSQSERTTNKRREAAASQGLKDDTGAVLEKTVVSPMRTCAVDASAGGAIEAIPAREGVRYYIHNVQLNIRNGAGATNTALSVQGYIEGALQYLAFLSIVPGVAGVENVSCILDVLLDPDTAVIAQAVDATSAAAYAFITYQEIPTDV